MYRSIKLEVIQNTVTYLTKTACQVTVGQFSSASVPRHFDYNHCLVKKMVSSWTIRGIDSYTQASRRFSMDTISQMTILEQC